jgi:hypothetical protein
VSTKIKPLTEAEARRLTNEIDVTKERHWALLYEAKTRKAWTPLGYENFGEYVQAEFAIKRAQAYNIIRAYEMKQEIQDALGGTAMPNVGSTALAGIPRDSVEQIAQDMKNLAAGSPITPAVAKEVLRAHSSRVVAPSPARRGSPAAFTAETIAQTTSFGGDDLPPYFTILWDTLTVLEDSTSERDLYRGFDVLVQAYDRLFALLGRLEEGAEDFLSRNPDLAEEEPES